MCKEQLSQVKSWPEPKRSQSSRHDYPLQFPWHFWDWKFGMHVTFKKQTEEESHLASLHSNKGRNAYVTVNPFNRSQQLQHLVKLPGVDSLVNIAYCSALLCLCGSAWMFNVVHFTLVMATKNWQSYPYSSVAAPWELNASQASTQNALINIFAAVVHYYISFCGCFSQLLYGGSTAPMNFCWRYLTNRCVYHTNDGCQLRPFLQAPTWRVHGTHEETIDQQVSYSKRDLHTNSYLIHVSSKLGNLQQLQSAGHEVAWMVTSSLKQTMLTTAGQNCNMTREYS